MRTVCSVNHGNRKPPVTRRAPAPARRATNITLPESLLREARALKINLSQACETGLAAEVARGKAEAWLLENRAAIDSWNEHVDAHGIPLAEFRQF
jgi:antitoxin CcdA